MSARHVSRPCVHSSLQNARRYIDIVTYKTAYYSFFLPIACALHLAGVTDGAAFDSAKAILVKMGTYFQIQDDYLDAFADAEVLGKIGTDIQDNKCSWLICRALDDVSAEQRALIQENYGKDEPACIERIKQLYRCVAACSAAPRFYHAAQGQQIAATWASSALCRDLELERKFKEVEASSYSELCGMIENQTHLPRGVYEKLLAKIYKRSK